MRSVLFCLAAGALLLVSTIFMGCKRIRGNGIMATQERQVARAERISLMGSYDVEIEQGAQTMVKVEADENILPYILTRNEDGKLVIRSKNNVSFSTDHTIKVYITTPRLEQLNLAGSGNITGKNKFTGGDKLKLSIAGSGDIRIEVNTPSIEADIAGSGSMTLQGETRDQTIKISGVGDYNADALKSETAKIKIAGVGNVKVFADASLDVNIAGGGSVYYKGNPSVKQHVSGSGEVKKTE
jgi:hypothetical protein